MIGEQLSANLATAGRQASDLLTDAFSALPVKRLHAIICGLLVIWVLYGLIQLIMVFIPPSTASSSNAPAEQLIASGDTKPLDIASLQALNLFGAAGAAPQVEVVPEPTIDAEALNAEKTKLNLSLEGIVYSPDSQASVAVIVYQGKQEQYVIGDKMPAGNRVTLAQILMDKVILDNNGQYESLWLYDDSKSAVKSPRKQARPVEADNNVADMRDNQSVTGLAKDYRQRLYKNPSSLAEVIRITPAQRDGQMIGYRISPGKDREQFQTLGLKANDIVTSINSIALDEPSNALEIYKLMRTATEASFTIDRNGEILEIMVSLSGDQ